MFIIWAMYNSFDPASGVCLVFRYMLCCLDLDSSAMEEATAGERYEDAGVIQAEVRLGNRGRHLLWQYMPQRVID